MNTYRGILNDHITFSPASVYLQTTGQSPKLSQAGDPLKGETLRVDFSQMMDSDLCLRLQLDKAFFIDGVQLTLGDKTPLTAVSLYAGEQLLKRYTAETDSVISKSELFLDAGVVTGELTLRFTGELSGVALGSLEVYGCDAALPLLFPTPASADYSGTFTSAALLEKACWDCPEGRSAAAYLAEKTGIAVSEAKDAAFRLTLDTAVPTDGCCLNIEENAVSLRASNLRGFIYGAETIAKLLQKDQLPVCRIADHPAMPWRGAHLMIPSRENIPFFQRVVKYILSPMGYNFIILQISAGMEFKRHPEINEAYVNAVKKGREGIWPPFPHASIADGQFITQDETRALVAYCRSLGIEVIPEIQSLGHVQYLTIAYPEIAEVAEDAPRYDPNAVDAREEDVRPADFYHHNYCPSNERSYELIFDLMDEIIEVIEPREYVHMGHDEVYGIGLCPKCRQKDPADLFAGDINRLHGYLAAKNLKMMIWADMLQPVTKYKTPAAIRKIPKDILMLDFIWYFHMDKDIEDNLLAEGFQVMMGNMYSSHYPRYESRIRKPGMVGAQISAWTTTNEEELGREGKLYDFLYTGEMLWSASYDSRHRLSYDRILKAIMPTVRQDLRQIRYPKANQTTLLLENTAVYPLSAPAKTGCETEILCDSLVFEHATVEKITRIPWITLRTVGHYEISYIDGTILEIPLTYGGNISHWNRRQNEPFRGGYYRHNGYSGTYFTDATESKGIMGENISVYRYEWLNPKPETPIRAIHLCQYEGQPTVFPHKITAIKE